MNFPQALTKMMQAGVDQNVFPGAVLLCAKNKQIVYHKAFGCSDLFTCQPMEKDSIFDLASLTKPLATTLVTLKLIQLGKLDLHQPVSSVLEPFAASDKGQITIDMLLRHTSGYPAYQPYYETLTSSQQPARQLLRSLLLNQPLENPVGTCQLYSDLGFMLLAWVVETVAGQRLDQAVTELVYRPLAIEHLFFIDLRKKEALSHAMRAKLVATQVCPWRKKCLKGEVDDDNAWACGGIEGHAGLFGDAFAVYQLCCELLDALQKNPSQVIDPDILAGFVQKHQGFDRVAGFDTPAAYGSSAGRCFSSHTIGHLGFTGTSFWLDPFTGLNVILLTNRVHPSRSNEKIKAFRPVLHDLICCSGL